MSDDFLSRWSRRKHEARQAPPPEVAAPQPVPAAAPVAPPDEATPCEPLPPLESLTPESDFTPFMQGDVDPGTRRQALKTLFQDPHYNVMDGLDTYIADYSKPDPLPEGWLEKMNQVARLGEYLAPEEKERRRLAEAQKAATEAVPADEGAQPSAALDVQPEEPPQAPQTPVPVAGIPTRSA